MNASWLRTPPLRDTRKRRKIIYTASCTFLIAAFALCIIASVIGSLYYKYHGSDDPFIASLVVGPMIWVYALFYLIPILLIIWPIANAALQLGYAEWGGAMAACGVFMAILLRQLSQPFPDVKVSITGLVAGVLCGAIYWFGAYRRHTAAFQRWTSQ